MTKYNPAIKRQQAEAKRAQIKRNSEKRKLVAAGKPIQKIRQPCWFHNNGGCSKDDETCKYLHVSDPKMRKPMHLLHPCRNYHLKTPGSCSFEKCKWDHLYALNKDEWRAHFDCPYPGKDYLEPKIKVQDPTKEEFPALSAKLTVTVKAVIWPAPQPEKKLKEITIFHNWADAVEEEEM